MNRGASGKKALDFVTQCTNSGGEKRGFERLKTGVMKFFLPRPPMGG